VSNIKHFAASRYTTKCEQCGKKFEATPKTTRGRFCSRKCFGKWQSANINGERHPHHGKKLGRPKALPPPVKNRCIQCGKEFKTKACHVDRRKCCSKQCQSLQYSKSGRWAGANSPTWRGGYDPYYGPSWRKAQRDCRARDKVCQECGKTPEANKKALDVHHKIPFRKFGAERHLEANHLSNLVALCHGCHVKVEPRKP
jgi:hypothetical protein